MPGSRFVPLQAYSMSTHAQKKKQRSFTGLQVRGSGLEEKPPRYLDEEELGFSRQ